MYKTKKDWGTMHPAFEGRQISANPHDRATLPSDVLSFSMPDTWRDAAWRILSDQVTDEVRSAFCAAPPKYLFSDDLGWLDDIIEMVSGEPSDIKALLGARLREAYGYFRAGHATRTDDLTPYYERGLRVLRPEEAQDKVRYLFLNGQFRGVSETRLEAAIEEVGEDTRAGHLYFAAREDSLYTEDGSAGHYLVYGSEYLYCLAIRVAGTMTAKKVLSRIGRPTMFVCDIPMDQIRDGTLEEFAGMMLEYLFAGLVEQIETEVLSPWSGSALSIWTDVAPECIVGHYHPEKVFDPLWNAW